MYNITTTDLTLTVYKNNQAVLSRQIPASLLAFVHNIYLNDVNDGTWLEVTANGNKYTLHADAEEPIVNCTDNNQLSCRIYGLIQTGIKQEAEAAKSLAEFEAMLIQQQRQREAEAKKLAEETRQHELRRIQIEAENQRKSQAEIEAAFKKMVEQRQQAEAEVERLKAERETRIASLTVTLLDKLKNDPTSVVEILESEIIESEAVQLAVADAIGASDEACRLVIESPQHLWNSNFIIMKAIILKTTYNYSLAQVLGTILPEDHLLIQMLNKVGKR